MVASVPSIIPGRFDERKYQQDFRQLYRQWAQERNTRERWEPVNVRFQHNPDWKNNFFSIDHIANDRSELAILLKVGMSSMLVASPLIMAGAGFLIVPAAAILWSHLRHKKNKAKRG